MRTSLYWIAAGDRRRLAIMPRPRAGDWLDDEIAAWRADGVDIVVSLLEAHEVTELELQREAALCRNHGIEFISFPIPDRGVPASRRAADELARRLETELAGGKSVAVHCRIGIGRSALLAACVLIVCGYRAEAALQMIADARRVNVPDTDGQRDWLISFAATQG